jgi:thiamine-monophosphate kinase
VRSEDSLTAWIASRTAADRPDGLLVGIGDDAAALSFPAGMAVLVSADSMVEGVHFSFGHASPAQVGRKAVAVNVSDMAACGGRGRFITCQIGIPRRIGEEVVRACLQGVIDAARDFGMALVGGNISSTEGPCFIDVTILGEAAPDRILTRRGARPGDLVVVSGRPGESAAGLRLLQAGNASDDPSSARVIARHLDPEPRQPLGLAAAEMGVARAAIDISDGLALDLHRLCRASGMGARLDRASLPVSTDLAAAARRLGIDPVDLLLHGGEDYELILAVPSDRAGELSALANAARVVLTVIGRFAEGSGLTLADGQEERNLSPTGWDHLA